MILKKNRPLNPTGSLAWRVLIISVLLLVLPLALRALFLFKQEYQLKLHDVSKTLEVIVKDRAYLIGQIIHIKANMLDIFDPEDEKFARELHIERVPLPSSESHLPQGGHFILTSKRRSALIVGKKESASTAIIVAIPFSQFVQNLEENRHAPFQIRVALEDNEGNLLEESFKMRADQELLTATAPIANTDLKLLLTVPRELILGMHKRDYFFHFVTLILFVAVFGGGAVYLLTRRIAKPLIDLCKTMRRVSDGALHARYTPDRMGFEINDLGKQFNETLDALILHSQQAEKERIAREKLAEEFRIGHDIQLNLLPTH